ncbi:hypothetical protein L345_08183, partial [Ophiophagus hannah]
MTGALFRRIQVKQLAVESRRFIDSIALVFRLGIFYSCSCNEINDGGLTPEEVEYLDIFQSGFRSKNRAAVVLAILLGDLCRDLNRGSILLLVLLDFSVWGSISEEDGPSQTEPSMLSFKHLSP